MRAIHKYNKHTQEGARRIAQSMGYKFSIYDMPDMIKLLHRAGIDIDGIDYSENSTQIINDNVMDYKHLPDTKTITF